MEDGRMTIEELRGALEEARRRIAGLEKAVEVLHDSEEKYQSHFLLANDIMFSYNDQFRVLSVSPNVERILGYKPEEFIAKTFYEVGVLNPDCMSLAVSNALKVLSGQTVLSSLYEFIARDGSRKFGEVSGVPIMRDGKVVKVVTVARDVTHLIEMEESLKKSEERYRTTLEGMPDAVSIMRIEDARLLYVNNGFTRMTGFDPDEAIGKTPFDLHLGEDSGDMDKLISLVREEGKVDFLPCRCRRRDGAVIDASVSARPVDYDGEACVVMVMTDISGVKQIEDEKKILEIQTQKIEALGTLARGIAHDFNNILTTIIGYTRMSLKEIQARSRGGKEFASVSSNLNEVQKSALRARDLVDQILAFSRYTEKVHIPLALGPAVMDSLKILRSIVPGTVEIRENLSEQGMIRADAGQIHQVVMNICTNAVHAMADGKGVITVDLSRTVLERESEGADLDLTPGPYLKLSISDTGSGMNEKILARAFDPYFTTREKEQGAGLGLSVVYGIVKGHGGGICCRSAPGKGAVFEIYFPEVPAMDEDLSYHGELMRMPRARADSTGAPPVPRKGKKGADPDGRREGH